MKSFHPSWGRRRLAGKRRAEQRFSTTVFPLTISLTVVILTWVLAGSIEPLRAQVPVAGCTEAALTAALLGGGHVIFTNDCTLTVTRRLRVVQDGTILDANGHNVVITASNAAPLLDVSAELTLKNLTFANGTSPNDGGAIYIHSNVLVIAERCIFAGNSAVGTNGLSGANGTTNANFTGGNGTSGTPGVSGLGGAIYNLGQLALVDCILTNNTAAGGNGGNGGNGGAGGGTFQVGGNAGDGAPGGYGLGGAVYNLGDLTLIDCTFSGNLAIGGAAGVGGAGGTGINPGMPGNGGVGGNGSGGAVFNARHLTLVKSTFSANSAQGGASATAGMKGNGNGLTGPKGGQGSGGALYNSYWSAVTNCTFYTNVAIGGGGGNGGNGGGTFQVPGDGGDGGDGVGGGIANINTITNVNCTFSSCGAFGGINGVAGGGNSLGGGTNSLGGTNGLPVTGNPSGANGNPGNADGGNIAGTGGVTALKNSILNASVSGPNAFGVITDLGYNLSSDALSAFGTNSFQGKDPLLAPLGPYGGPTLTMALLTNSPAIDRIPADDAPATDQRGFLRPAGAKSDIGAFEFGSITNTITTNAVNVVLSLSRTPTGAFQLNATGNSGASYQIQTSTNLVQWQTVTTNGSTTFIDVPNNIPFLFYRVRR